MNKQVKSTIILLITAMIWGFAFTAQVMVDADVLGNFSFNGIRFLLGATSLIPVILLFEREPEASERLKRTVITGAMTGFILFCASSLQQIGISINHNAGKAGFITGFYMILVPFFGVIVFRRKIGLNVWLAAVIAIFGLFLISAGDGFDSINKGDVVVLIGAFFWAAHILMVDTFSVKASPIKFSFVQFVVCGLCNLIVAAFSETITWSGVSATMIPILYTGLMSTGVAYTCQVIGQRDADPNFAAIVMSSECVFSAIGGAIILHENLGIKGYVGCVLMFAGIILSQLNVKKKGADNCAAK